MRAEANDDAHHHQETRHLVEVRVELLALVGRGYPTLLGGEVLSVFVRSFARQTLR